MLTTSVINIACTILNLLILYFLAKKFLFERIDNIFKARQEEVEEATRAAELATKEALATKKEYEQKIELADEEKEQILADIKKQGYDEYETIVAEAKKKGEQIVMEARHNAEVEGERAKEAYASQLTDMVIDAAAKIAAKGHSTEEDRELYEKFINEAGAYNE